MVEIRVCQTNMFRFILLLSVITITTTSYADDQNVALSPWLKDVPRPDPVKAPSVEEIQRSIMRGVDFLVEHQNPDGSWGGLRRTKVLDVAAPIPGAHHTFRAAVTAMCIEAVIEVGDQRETHTDRAHQRKDLQHGVLPSFALL